MKVLFLNNGGGGTAQHLDVTDGTTVGTFLVDALKGERIADYKVRVNREIASADQVLQDGDRVSATPAKVSGATL